MAEFIVCFGSDDEKKENKHKKLNHNSFRKETDRKLPNKKRKKHIDSINSTDNSILQPSSTLISLFNHTEILIPSNIIELPTRQFKEELDNGNIEYKLKLIPMNTTKLEKRITQLKFRLQEGQGNCIYYIGIEDSGNALGITKEDMTLSIECILKMATVISATISYINYLKGQEGVIAEISIHKTIVDEKELKEIKIGLFGEEDSGKSTLIGCLISDMKDNGKGLTRTNVFRHRHEINCGKTSSFTHQIIGFDINGRKTNKNSFGTLNSWEAIVKKSEKIVNFIDMGGSEKSLNNSLKTLSSNYLDYIFLVISAKFGITQNTIVCLKLALLIGIPIVVVFSKVDLVSDEEMKELTMNFTTVLKKLKQGKNMIIVKDANDVVTFAKNMDEGIMPTFLISNTNGAGLENLNNFIGLLPTNNNEDDQDNDKEKVQFDFLEIIHKKEIGNLKHIIIEGIIAKGKLYKGKQYYVGPFNDGMFKLVKVMNVHCKKMEVHNADKGQFCSVELEFPINDINNTNSMIINDLRPSMVLLNQPNPIATSKFQVELQSMSDCLITIKSSYQPIVHLSHISQCVKISAVNEITSLTTTLTALPDSITIKPNEKIHLNFQFLYHPEFLETNSLLIILDNHIKLYGHVIGLIS